MIWLKSTLIILSDILAKCSFTDKYREYHPYIVISVILISSILIFFVLIFYVTALIKIFRIPVHFLKLPPLCKRSIYPRVSASKVSSPLRWLRDCIGVSKRQFVT